MAPAAVSRSSGQITAFVRRIGRQVSKSSTDIFTSGRCFAPIPVNYDNQQKFQSAGRF
jgi:hypothetical protein